MAALTADTIRRTSGPQSPIGPGTVPAAADTYYVGSFVVWGADVVQVPGASDTERLAGIVQEQVTVTAAMVTAGTNGIKVERPVWVDVELATAAAATGLLGSKIVFDDDGDGVSELADAAADNEGVPNGICIEAIGTRARILLDYHGTPQAAS